MEKGKSNKIINSYVARNIINSMDSSLVPTAQSKPKTLVHRYLYVYVRGKIISEAILPIIFQLEEKFERVDEYDYDDD